MKPTVRTRFAPSPTGFLHIGGVRTALYAYAWAKKHNGQFLLRIEDTDQARYVPEAIAQIVRSLHWVGIVPDEGVVGFENNAVIEKGDCGPYVQSQRITLYTEFAQKLLSQKKAYRCFCSPERLEEMRQVQMASKQMPKYDRHCLQLSEAEIDAKVKAGEAHVLRFYVPEGPAVSWDDVVFGTLTFEREQIDDFVMIKADGFPTYNFANVVDDHTMRITHVIRAQEFLSSTPKHLLLYEAFGVDKPVFAHTSHILGKDKKKLSKRHAAVSADEYRKMGYLPNALLNFISLLGWTHPEQKDVFSLDEFINVFDIKDMHKTGAVFDTEKSLWMNGQYIRQLTAIDFAKLSVPFLREAGLIEEAGEGEYLNLLSKKTLSTETLQAILATEQPRVKRLDEVAAAVRFFFEDTLLYEPKLLMWKKMKAGDLLPVLKDVKAALDQLPASEWKAEAIKAACEVLVQKSGRTIGDVFWPFRVAVSGRERSPSPQDIAFVLGKEQTLARLEHAIGLATGANL